MSNNKPIAVTTDKIAIVGIACRLPGGIATPDDYWQVLREGRDVVTQVSEERFGTDFYQHPNRKEPGKSVTFAAGVLADVEHFDAEFFGISPREAAQLDPQQRLLLELSWEALENAGQVPEDLSGSDCAVYVGIASTDYLNRRVDDPASMDAYTMTGNTASIASNRLSYIYNLHGPSVSVDTACSSSLVAVHHACQAIRSGEASMAIAGGVNMLLHPFAFVGFSQASMLSENGRCRTFDANGDGYVRAEGAAVLFLKPLAQAEADGDPIHGVIVASGINSDGRTNGLTVPSANQQGNLLRKVYAQADVEIDDLVYLEAHGTGTAVGDPIETKAIGEVLGQRRSPDNPLLIGSAKSNLGHLETASGMAGLIKAVLSLQHQQIPPSLHVETPNPAIEFEKHHLKVVTEATEMANQGKRQLVGVNSFGFGGANAHVLIEHYAANAAPLLSEEQGQANANNFPPLYLSAQNHNALQAMAAQYADWLSDEKTDYYDVAWSASQHRQHLQEGLVVSAASREQLCAGLAHYAEGEESVAVSTGALVEANTGLTMVFSGNGSQWQGMGQAFLESCPDFKAAVREVDELFSAYADYSLLDEFAASEEDSRLQLTEIAQPLLFAYQVGVVRTLEKQGVRADTVIGHSVGEVAAAWAAGALSLEQAVRVIYERSHAQSKTAGLGRMAAAGLGPEAVREKLQALGLQDRVEVAGINSPYSVTLSGALADLEALGGLLESEGAFYRILDLDYAFHSHCMEPVRDELLVALADLVPVAEDRGIRFISTVVGGDLAVAKLDAHYWWDNIRQPVLFADGLNTLLGDGAKVWLEVGPHAILRNYINECQREKNVQGRVLTTGLRKKEQADALTKAAHTVWLAGCPIDWSVHFPGPGKFIAPPAYPWQRERYWYPLTTDGYDLVNRRREHPLLGYRLRDAEAMWENQLDIASDPLLADHIVDGAVVIPAAAYVEMALAASSTWYKTDSHVVENFEIRAPVMLEEGRCKSLRLNLDPVDGGFTISSRERQSSDAWTLNVVGRLTGVTLKQASDVTSPCLENYQAQASEVILADEHYRLTEAVGLSYLTAFQTVKTVWASGQGALAEVELAESQQAKQDSYLLHPSLLDGAFQVLVDVFREDIRAGQLMALIPIQIGKLNLFDAQAEVRYLQLKIRKKSPRSVVADFLLLDQQGRVVGELVACRFRGVKFSRNVSKAPDVYEFVARLKPGPQDQSITPHLDLPGLTQHVHSMLNLREDSLQRQQHHEQIAPLLEVLATRYAWDALTQLVEKPSALFTVSGLLQANVIDAAHRPLLHSLLDMLADSGLAALDEQAHWSLAAACDLPAAQDIWLAILGDSPAHLPELVMLGRCGENLTALLRGEWQAENLLTPAKSSIRDHWLDSSPGLRAVNLALSTWVQHAVATWPQNQRVRILELGAANGALAHRLLPLLPAASCDYVFSDPNGDKVEQASAEFEEYSFFNALQLDVELSGENYQQLCAMPGFDLVIVADALYPWGEVASTLPRLKALLNPQGVLAMGNIADSRFLALTYGLEPEWWHALDDGDNEAYLSRLLSVDEWAETLRASGFGRVETLAEPGRSDKLLTLAIADEQPLSLAGALPKEVEQDGQVAADLNIESWLIITGPAGFAAELTMLLQQQLEARGCIVVVQQSDAVTVEQRFDHVVHLAGLSVGGMPDDLMALQQQRCFTTLDLVQQLDQRGENPHLWLVTAGAVDTGVADQLLQPEQAPLWGLGRVLMNEHPELSCTLIDLQQVMTPQQSLASLLNEFLSPDGEDEVLLGNGARRVMRLQQTSLLSDSDATQKPPAVCLDFTAPGPLKHLYWRILPEQDIEADEIEIRPHASGLNFRDVMYAMGLLSDEAVENGFAGAALGMELSGKVVRVGAAVTDFKAGDAVIGFAPACFSTRVITRTTAVAHKPESWTDEEAATVPTTFFTVYYALQHLAHLEEGERVLIHGASGGVGLAAIQFARYRGAEVFATAGTDEKREFVRLMGADHVMDSRSLHFAEEVMRLTGGEGVDIVLNSISGEAINKNLDILRPFGRFLELGKRDFYENSKVGLRPFRNNISYFGIDADQLLVERPALAGRLFREMMALFEEGVLRPLPHRVFSAARIQEAFRYMQQSRQIGKVIVSFADNMPMTPTFPDINCPALQLSADASYLVTGGFSGFGLRTAQWLVEKGARTLVLLSRSGKGGEQAQQVIADLEAQGVTVATYACDVADHAAMSDVFADMAATLPVLRGLVHAAMVLDDAIVRNMSTESFREVLAPKTMGAQNLHQLTMDMPLDLFVMYSSITTYLGNPGQANYVAANMYLETLTAQRRKQGLPAVYAAWGAIDDVGYLARNEEVKDALQSRLGGKALSSDRALVMLEQLLAGDKPGAAVIDMDWNTVQRVMPGARSPKYTEQQRLARSVDEGDQGEDIATLTAGLNAEEVQALVAELLVAEVGEILRLPREKLSVDKSVFDLGMDSLMGMELVLAIEERFGVRLPVMALTEGATVSRIAEKIAAQLDVVARGEAQPDAEELQKQSIAAVVRQHGSDMSEAELEQLAQGLSQDK